MLLFTTKSIFKKTALFFAVLGLFFPLVSFSQMTVTTSGSASVLTNAISGSGVTTSNATINCGQNGAGSFIFWPTLGISSGILLTTGTAVDAANAGTHVCNLSIGNNFSDPDLTAIVPTATFDVCMLEFDFIPACDSLRLQFVFGSDEYPQAVNLQYNDAFGIFLSGPTPAGGSYSAQNIATLPNGTAVSIHNVNASTNSGFFHNNYTNPNSTVAYNGYTIPITSITPVVPCSTYHVKFAIADAGNALYDSGVFLSNNTLSCSSTPVLTASTTPSSGCNNTGSATAIVSNYNGTPVYHWMPGGQNTATISNIASGTYTCTVTFNQACGTATQTITATVSSVGSNIVLTSTQQNLTCNGGNNASATVSAIGGTSPYSCSWSTTPVQTGLTATNLSAGTYTATVNDNGGCHSSIQITVANPLAMQTTVGTTSTTCTGATGTASVNVTANGHSPYTYSWNTTPVQTTQTATNLSHGTYTVTITDASSCTFTTTATVPIKPASWSLASTGTNVPCYGGTSGVASANISNPGTSTFTYSWTTNPSQSTSTASNLPAGTYSCIVTDNNGCVITTTVNIIQPSQLVSNVSSIPTICIGSVGSATVGATGGVQPYTYAWSTTPPQTTSSIHNLPQGQYSVTVTDAHSCTSSTVAVITVTNPVLQITTSVVNSVCGGPSGSANVSSVIPNSPPYSYSWTPGGQTTQSITNVSPGVYSVTLTDANGCVGSTAATVGTNTYFPIQTTTSPDYCGKSIGSATAIPHANPPYQYYWNSNPPQTSQSAANLAAGLYTVVVTDGFNPNCKDSVVVIIGNTPRMVVTASASPTYCNQNFGSVTASPTGYAPYNYQWANVPVANSPTITDLYIGTYTVQVTDSKNCVATATATVFNQNDVIKPKITTQPDGDIYSETPVTIGITTNSGWTLDSAYLSNGAVWGQTVDYTFEQSGDYTATYYYTSTHGCVDSVEYHIHVIDYSTLYIPNAFTPNGDGVNDFFKADGSFIYSFEMNIYDRWGNLIITLDDINKSWNGKEKGQNAPPDVYVYNGTAVNAQGKSISFHGRINLIR